MRSSPHTQPAARADQRRGSGFQRRQRVYLVVEGTLSQQRRSGIQRVVVETGRALARQREAVFVRYDDVEGGLRPFSVSDHQSLWGGGIWPNGVLPHEGAMRVGATLTRDTVEGWILLPEVPGHGGMHIDRFARIISQARAAGMKVAAIFYDLIPLEDPRYAAHSEQHAAYVAELVRCDFIIAISDHSRSRLVERWRNQGVVGAPEVIAVPLPDGDAAAPRPAEQRNAEIVLVGTVEPRKRQVEFLELFDRARARSSALRGLTVRVIGSIHPAVSDRLGRLSARADWLRCDDYVSDEDRREAVSGAAFTVFPSENEGFGLPISESLALGTPCLCANFGSMAEIALGGGCLTVDIRDDQAVESALIAMAGSPEVTERLRAELILRRFSTWSDYARAIGAALDTRAGPPSAPKLRLLKISDARSVDQSALLEADLVEVPSARVEGALVAQAVKKGWPYALPPIAVGPAERRQLSVGLGTICGQHAHQARSEAAYAAVRKAHAGRQPKLRIAISTHNRKSFVIANVRWLLDRVLPQDGTVDLHVMDGASTDGSAEALRSIIDPRLAVTTLAADPGMQGGLALVSRLEGADYVWIVGDDDFILPDQFAAVRRGLAASYGAPVGVVNFAVYHRQAWSNADTVAAASREARGVAAAVAPSGRMPLREAIIQNDNLLTAIYTLIWRADVLAAAYDRPRPDPGFSTLQSAAPCSDFLLRHFGGCNVYWHAEPAIAGNAHNSWGSRRVEWHGAAMPDAFDLAMASGADRETIQVWADRHAALLEEARVLYPGSPALSPVARRRAARLMRRGVA